MMGRTLESAARRLRIRQWRKWLRIRQDGRWMSSRISDLNRDCFQKPELMMEKEVTQKKEVAWNLPPRRIHW